MKAALVTGAGRPGSLGAALCRRLADDGWAVAVHYRSSRDDAETLARSLPRAIAVGGDLADEDGARRVVDACSAEFGRLDALIHSTGTYHAEPLATLTAAHWREGLDSTATAAFFTSRAAWPHLKSAGHGRIIHLGDAGCDTLRPRDLALSYHIGKAGVLILAKSLARLTAPDGITVNVVSPGYLENSIDLDTAPPIPAGRPGTFDDVWNAIRFLLDPASGYITGSHLKASGGWSL